MKTKSLFFSVFLFLVSINPLLAQMITDNGYFILNSGEKIEAQIILNETFKTPNRFKYLKNGNIITIESSEIKELSVRNLKYIRKKVDLDISSNLEKISNSKDPIYKTQSLLLKVIIEGKLSLYKYSTQEYLQFFLKKNDSMIPLIYKKYSLRGKSKKNKSFRNQIAKLTSCKNKISRLKYNEKKLTKFLVNELNCKNEDYLNLSKHSFTPKELISITPRLGYQINNGNYESRDFPGIVSTPFSASSISYGLEGEAYLPFANRKFSLVAGIDFLNIDEVYNYTTNSSPQLHGVVTHDHKITNAFFGVRYNYFINTSSSFSLGMRLQHSSRGGNTTFDFNPSFIIGQAKVDMEDTTMIGFSMGYKYKKASIFLFYERYTIDSLKSSNTVIEDWAFRGVNTIHFKIGYDIF